MTGIGLIILALSVILLTIPHILLLTKLLTRPPLPAKFLNNEGDKVIELLQEEERWRRKQCCWTILGYMFGWGMIVFFTCHILVMTIIMGESTTNSWLKALLITAIIDYCFLQTSKGIVLMCCLSEGFIDFVITIFAGHVI